MNERSGVRFWLLSFALVAIVLLAGFALWLNDDTPPFDESWSIAAPASQGMDQMALEALDDELVRRSTDAWLVVRNGKIVHEWYRDPSVNRRFGAASMSKALVGGLGLMLAADRGLLQWEQPASQYVDSWRDVPQRSAVTLWQLANHSSGMAHPVEPDEAGEEAALWETRFWERHDDLMRHIEQDVPFLFQPGTAVSYSGPGYVVLSRALGEAMRGSEWTDLKSLLDKELMTQLDLHPQSWSIGYDDDLFRVDGLNLHATWGGAAFTLRATARIGQLLLQRGVWQKRQLLSDHVVKRAITFDGMTTTPTSIQTGQQPAPALGWWSNEFGALKSLPRDAFLAAGAGHRVLIVVPSLDLVIVRYGKRLGVDHWDGDFWQVLDEVLLAPVIHAIDDDHQSATCCQ